MLSDLSSLELYEVDCDGLNPCCAGLCSLTSGLPREDAADCAVLILVVLDYGL